MTAGWDFERIRPASAAKGAGAVPLGEAATGSCPQQFQVRQVLDFRSCVAVDLASEADFCKVWTAPGLVYHVLNLPQMKTVELPDLNLL